MMNIVYIEGVEATVQQFKFKFLAIAIIAAFSIGLIGCGNEPPRPNGQTVTGNAATVNGKAITMEEVEREIKAQTQGQESRLSQLELAQARLQVLQNLIQQEVMYQQAEKEKTIPSEEDITTEFNRMKTESRVSAEEFQKEMERLGETDATFREKIKKDLSVKKLIEKITGKVDAPKDSEIEAFFKGNPEAFVKKKGVRLSAIVVDPRKLSDADTTVDEASAALKIKEISTKLNQGLDFATIARENSEDQSAQNGGDLGYISEDQLKQAYGGQLAGFMDPKVPVGKLIGAPLDGKYFFFKLVERSDKDEVLTLESPGVRQQITDALTNGRKNLVSQAFAAQAMNEARIDNLLLRKIIEDPNSLSGARPAVTPDANANTNTATSNTNTASNANAGNAGNTASNADTANKTEANSANVNK